MVGVILIASISTRSYAETYDEWNIDEEAYRENSHDDESYSKESEDLIASSLWVNRDQNGKGHTNLPECVMDNFSGKNKNLIHECLVFGSEKADNAKLHDTKMNKVQLHAMGNYILHLNALWLYAKKISYNKTDDNCRDQVLNELRPIKQDEQKDLKVLLETIPEIYKLYKNEKGHNPTNFEKQYLVLGLALHLIGDIYAHRSIVTIEGVKQAISNGVMNKNDFRNFDEFITKVKQGKIRCSRIDEEMKKKSNTKYEDNSAFMPNRFLYSKKTCKSFISNYVKNDASFNVNYIKRSDSDGIILQSFENYIR